MPTVHLIGALARPESRAPLAAAAAILGAQPPHFLDFLIGEIAVDLASKRKLVDLLRATRPDILITQDPEHAQHDLDPDRRPDMTLF